MATTTKKNTIKLQDSSPVIGNNSRLESYWKTRGYDQFYKRFRSGANLPAVFHTVESKEKIIQHFNLNSIGYGNWVTQEDRFNYLSALIVALYDMERVLGFKANIGLNKMVSISFGARGKGGALAHFEPGSFIINVTRYKENPAYDKEHRFINTGGAGSLAHEYGHALDYYFGMYKEMASAAAALSMGSSISTRTRQNKGTMRQLMDDLLLKIIWQQEGQQYSAYYQRLQQNFGGDYMFRRAEIFARAFEVYIKYKLQKTGILNKFLNETKYTEKAYLTTAELERVLPQFDRLIYAMRLKL